MKAKAFLQLVGKMLTAQQNYYKARKYRDGSDYGLLINAKELEGQVLAVVMEGHLEPDEPLDSSNVQRHPVAPEQANLFDKENDNGKSNA